HSRPRWREAARGCAARSALAVLEFPPPCGGVSVPFCCGHPHCLGASPLRRVLLSSLQVAAIISIRIENGLHELSSLAGVREGRLRRQWPPPPSRRSALPP